MKSLKSKILVLGFVLVMVAFFVSGCASSNTEDRNSNLYTDNTEDVNSDPNTDNTEERISDRYENGKIVFQWAPLDGKYPDRKDLFLMDGNGNNIRYLGSFTGSPAISPDGNSIAIGCGPGAVMRICILDIGTILSGEGQFPEEIYARPEVSRKLTMPEKCWGYQYEMPEALYEGVLSIDWSPEGDKLVVVCGELLTDTTEVCILPLDGEAYCWDESAAEGVARVVWSPTDENTLATSGGWPISSEIYLVDSYGENKRFLTTGWSPEWSPDGSRIAFINEIPGEDNSGTGIAIINPDGSNLEWVYQPNPYRSETFIILDMNGNWDQYEAIRLAWSPDGKYIAFTSTYYAATRLSLLFRVDIETGEVIVMIDPNIFTFWVTEVDWGP